MEPHRRLRDARRGPISGSVSPRTRNCLDLMRIAVLRRPARAPGRARGQSLVEFALVLIPLMLLILGVVQFGLIFNSYVTMTNAAREGARTGTIYVYDRTLSKTQNDTNRDAAIRASVLGSMNLLAKTSPQFAASDLTITYENPNGVPDTETRTGQTVKVRAVYHQDLIIPMISALLPKDSGGRLALPGEVTMVIN